MKVDKLSSRLNNEAPRNAQPDNCLSRREPMSARAGPAHATARQP
jgi:hypothetical protein